MTKSKLALSVSLSFLAGVGLASWFPLRADVTWLVLGAGIAAALAGYRFGSIRVAVSCACVAGAALGVVRTVPFLAPPDVAGWFDSRQTFTARVVEDPDARADRTLVLVRPAGKRDLVLLQLGAGERIAYGNLVEVAGRIQEPKVYPDFDYRAYLRMRGAGAVSFRPRTVVLGRGGNPAVRVLLSVKSWFSEQLRSRIQGPNAELALGILIGARRGLPPELTDAFTRTGTSHITAVSGFNVSLVLAAALALAPFLGRRRANVVGLGTVAAFTVMAGAGGSVLRAALMGLTLVAAQLFGRPYGALRALCFAAAFMVLWNPLVLRYDVGFQLSATATFGILLFLPLLENLTGSWPRLLGATEALLTTFSALAFSLPLILRYFGTLSFVAPLANVLILPAVPLSMLLSALAALPLVGPGFGFLAGAPLWYISSAATYLARLPGAAVSVGFPGWAVPVWWAALGAVLAYLARRRGALEPPARLW